MAKVTNLSENYVIQYIAEYIKSCKKNIGNNTNIELPIYYHNWGARINGSWKWTRSEISFNGNTYEFTNKELSEERFVWILRTALEQSGVDGKVFFQTYGNSWNGYQTIFEKIEIYADPCKEFIQLNKMLQKYAGKALNKTEIFFTTICGKRSSWSDTGRVKYLCFDANNCKNIINFIREKKTSKDKLTFKTDEYLSHGDEMAYDYAMYAESEWYGCRGNKLTIMIDTPAGRRKAIQFFG